MVELKVLIILTLVVVAVRSDFRFCHNGPHRIRDMECPGGFVAKKPINLTCAHYAISSVVLDGSIPQVVEDFCTTPDHIDLPVTGGYVFLKSFQEFYLNIIDPAAAPATPGNFTPPDVCETSCHPDWRDPNELPGEDHLNDKPTIPDQEKAEEHEREITKKTFINLLMDENFEEDDPLWYDDTNSTDPRILRLMAKSMQIVWSKCSPYVEDTFLRQTLKALIFLTSLNKKYTFDIGLEEYKVIDSHLNKCQAAANKAFKLKGTNCETYHNVESIQYLRSGTKYRTQARSFVWGMYDPIVGTAWAVVDFINGYCFGSFIADLNHHHMYAIAMEGLFPEVPVLKHWFTPISLEKGDGFWNSVFETVDIKTPLRNLDACVIAGYSVSLYKHRLERPFTPEEMLEKPTYTLMNSSSSNGWQKSVAQYWSMYESQGGFKELAKDWGYCLTDQDTKNKTVEDVKKELCTTTPTT